MTRPLWERTTTWGIANHLRYQGVGTDEAAYSLAALIVRDLDRRTGLSAEMAQYAFTSPLDVDDVTRTSPKYLAVMQRFWSLVGLPNPKAERNKLLSIALAAALRGGPQEAKAARELAQEARLVEPVKGRLGQEWTTGGSAWDGFGALRDEMALTGSSTVLAAYDRLVADTRDRAAVVKVFQTWAKNLEWYTGRIDGIWGPKTEAAFLRAVPTASGRISELRDVVPLRAVFGEAETSMASDGKAIAVLITRDVWLGKNPDKLAAEAPYVPPASPTPPEGGGGSVVMTYPKAERATSTPTPDGGSQIVISYPKTEGGGPPEQVAVELPPPGEIASGLPTQATSTATRDWLIGGGLVLGGALLLGAAWWMSRRQQSGPTLTESTP
jgi:hypothetical protein